MRILILGGDGMLGHQLLLRLRRGHEARATLRQGAAAYAAWPMFDARSAYFGVNVRTDRPLEAVFAEFRPEAVVNAVGIVKQRPEAEEAIDSIEVNALLPHRLALLCRKSGARLIHMSTDCVFSGDRGGYTEADACDARDLYGLSKRLGEVTGPGCLTLRTSIIGPELSRKAGLLEWFLAQRGPVNGYTGAIFSGFTTLEMARIVERLLAAQPGLQGLYHVAARPISKFDLLVAIRDALGLKTQIAPYSEFRCDRSLDASKFGRDSGYVAPGWTEMIAELAVALKGRTNDA
jgi:dTDP-4-dehydrorhamnose reductase